MTERTVYSGPLTDSRRWDRVAIRPDDVIVVTPPRCGTTWMQTIVALLLSGDAEVAPEVSVKMPWVDIRAGEAEEIAARLGAMMQRRCMKSHTPLDGIPLDDHAQYICVFRHPLDVHVSFRNHVRNIPIDVFDPWYPEGDASGAAFGHFLTGRAEGPECDAVPLDLILRHYRAARAVADRPNVTLFHYADMTRDLAGTFARLADLLGVTHPRAVMDRLVEAATFEAMKGKAARYVPSRSQGFFKSDAGFFNSGTSGQWQGVLSAQEVAAYDAAMEAALSPEDRAWLERGSAL